MNEKILVVDDELDILEMLSSFLTHEGFQVKTAPGGHAAIEIFKSETFDLVISDMRMPGMDGLTVMRRLKEMDEDIAKVLLNGMPFAEFIGYYIWAFIGAMLLFWISVRKAINENPNTPSTWSWTHVWRGVSKIPLTLVIMGLL